MIHRLVAEAFCTKTDESFEVNHIDNNKLNNHVENLEWISHKENLYQSYETLSPIRNFRPCNLITPNGNKIYFHSQIDLQRYIENNHLPCSRFSILYYGHSQNYYIEKL